jgi:hypothetical protein
MFDYEKVIKKLEDFKKLSDKKQVKYLLKLLDDDDFMSWLYNASEDKSNAPITTDVVERLYGALTKPKVMNAMIKAIDQNRYYLTRTHSTFVYSICNYAVGLNNERTEFLSKELEAGNIDKKEAKETKEKLKKYAEIIEALLKGAKKIVKYEAKELADRTNLSKELCIISYWRVPSPEFVPIHKVSPYLNTLLTTIYDDAAENGYRRVPNWRTYFTEIFGKDKLPSVATAILLEGVNRIDKYKNRDSINAVRDVWDSLTEFALKILNESPDDVRNQMVELYIRRIEKMFKNKTYDLRVNILSLPNQFDKLISTVSKYTDKINEILNPKKNNNNK